MDMVACKLVIESMYKGNNFATEHLLAIRS